jgi:hypothetical protein
MFAGRTAVARGPRPLPDFLESAGPFELDRVAGRLDRGTELGAEVSHGDPVDFGAAG